MDIILTKKQLNFSKHLKYVLGKIGITANGYVKGNKISSKDFTTFDKVCLK